MIRFEIYVEGRVQGVGYRFFTIQTASKFAVSGYAMNMQDGTVKIEVEGEKQELDKFVVSLESGPGYVKRVLVTEKKATKEFSGFSIRH